MSEISNCPFCNGKGVLYQHERRVWNVACNDCEAEGQRKAQHADAIAAWNRRTPVAEPAEAVQGEALTDEQILEAATNVDAGKDWFSYDWFRAGVRFAEAVQPVAGDAVREALPTDLEVRSVWAHAMRVYHSTPHDAPAEEVWQFTPSQIARIVALAASPASMTDAELDELISSLNEIAMDCDHYEYGLPMHEDEARQKMRTAILNAQAQGKEQP